MEYSETIEDECEFLDLDEFGYIDKLTHKGVEKETVDQEPCVAEVYNIKTYILLHVSL